jgi:transcriptional regulator with XRE-family HTH domain
MNKSVFSDLGNKEVFSRNLQRYVAMSGDKQTVIAKAVGVSGGTFCDWMKGRAYPRMDKVQLLADYFGIKKSDLVEDENIGKDTISNQDQKLLDLFHKVPDDKKEGFLKMIEVVINTQL